ncbi:DNA polymerase III subunit delta' [candidate division WOR-3 bacterium]|nr:DNA polymerase III subunit delta' [candidate division WOR-3 bacterium]
MSFNEIIGQTEVKALLKKSLKKNRIASAYLFVGPEGVGKTMTSLNFTKAMNCKIHRTDSCRGDDPDNVCPSCRKIDAFSHPDVVILFPVPKKIREEKRRNELLQEGKIHMYQKTEVIAIGDIRDVEETLLMKPFEAQRRVIIIIDAETMNQQAQNAFLKILEEPPMDTTIILTSSQPERLFLTIRSRCQRINFKRLSREEVREFLIQNGKLSDEDLKLACLLSNGSIKNASKFFNEEGRGEREILKELISDMNYEILSETFDKESLEKFINFLIPLFRDFLSAEFGNEVFNIDIQNYIRSVYKRYSIDGIRKTIDFLGESLINITRNVNPELISNVVYDNLKEG